MGCILIKMQLLKHIEGWVSVFFLCSINFVLKSYEKFLKMPFTFEKCLRMDHSLINKIRRSLVVLPKKNQGQTNV